MGCQVLKSPTTNLRQSLFEFFAKEKYGVVDPSFARGSDGIGKGPAY
tara:strand:- start:121 stop:261 length:141 start_codon:yes stop_codon:yes gene_type:complete